MMTELERIRYCVDDDCIQRLKEKAIRRSGQIFLPPACHSWREAVTVERGKLLFWYNTPHLGDEDGMDTRVVTETLV